MNGLPEKPISGIRFASALRICAHRVDHVAQLVRIGHGQSRDVRLVAHGPLEPRAFALGEIQAQAHRVGHGQDVGEQDRRVERKALERLQRDFGGAAPAIARGP